MLDGGVDPKEYDPKWRRCRLFYAEDPYKPISDSTKLKDVNMLLEASE